MAFLFIWQFIISGPLEIASGYIGFAQYMDYIWKAPQSSTTIGGIKIYSVAIVIGLINIALLYRQIKHVGKITVSLWVGTLLTTGAVILTGAAHFDPKIAFDFPPGAFTFSTGFLFGLGAASRIGVYDYLGYYNVCYIGDEVKNPGRTIPRAIMLSAVVVAVLFVGVHMGLLSVVPLSAVPTDEKALGDYNLTAEFMRILHGNRGAALITLLLIWCCIGSAFAGMLGYARIPYGAAKQGHFFSGLAK